MSVEHLPREVHELIAFTKSTREHLQKRRFSTGDEKEKENDSDHDECDGDFLSRNFVTFGGIGTDGCHAWLINERSMEIVSTLDGASHSMWEFGGRSQKPSSSIASVEINCAVPLRRRLTDSYFELVMGAEDGQSGGLVCVFDPSRNGLAKAIGVPRSVTALEAVSGQSPDANSATPAGHMLAAHLRHMQGVVAVGTRDGAVYLVDMQLDERQMRGDESNPGQLVFVNPTNAGDQQRLRDDSIRQNKFLVHCLNSNMEMTFSSGQVHVSSLRYLRQTGLLAVGYNFGGFQLWDLNTLTLEYSSPSEGGRSLSVVSFAFQEPDNDPRNDCYLWVVRGHLTGDDYVPEDITNATLYCLGFGHRTWTDGVGFCYHELSSCMRRFEWNLSLEPSRLRLDDDGILGSRLIQCSTVEEKPLPSCRQFQQRDSSDINCSSSPSDRENGGKSLCLFVWETFFVNSYQRPTVFLAVFDLNQWYLTQMPSVLRCIGIDPCPYLGLFSMSEICNRAGQGIILSIDIIVRTISRPYNIYPTEKLSYPSFLSFGVVALFTTGVVRATFPGLQGQAFNELTRGGSLLLVEPERTFFLLQYTDLLPLNGEPLTQIASQNVMRENILSMALEQNLISFLMICIRDWSAGRNVTDACNLRFFQDWAWKRITFIKKYIDRQCPILYDCSGLRLDASVVNCLHSRVAQLRHLERLLRRLVEYCPAITEQGSEELALKAKVTSLLAMHLDVVLWFLNYGLLPENHDSDEAEGGDNLVYPRRVLSTSYDELRAETQRLNSVIGRTEFLLIDELVSNAGNQIMDLWKKEEIEANLHQTAKDGLYPPPTLHALLSIFLLNGVSSSTKHRIVQYFFFDLAMLLNGGPHAHIVNNLVMYPAAHHLTSSLTKITQGFWLLDHKNFEEALSVLLHPIIEPRDISPEQHRRIMKSFLYHGEPKKALRYSHVRKPPQEGPDDRKFHLTLLIASGSVSGAFFYQREIRTQANAEDNLNHFLLGCLQANCFRDILQLSFQAFEEKCLETFLLKSPDKRCRDYLVLYFLIHSKYMEAKRLNDQLAFSEKLETDPASRERAATRKMLVDGFYRLLPKIQTEMFESACSIFAPGRPYIQNVARPCQSLSTRVRMNAAEPSTSSTFVSQVMRCVSDLWNQPSIDYTNTPIKTSPRDNRFALENVPFIGTPLLSNIRRTSYPNVVYPKVDSSVDSHQNDDESLFVGSPAKKPRILDNDSPPRSSARATHRQNFDDMGITEPQSLLQTPIVRRKIPSSRIATPSLDATPQSILKWTSNASSPASAFKIRRIEIEKKRTPLTTSPAFSSSMANPTDLAQVHSDTSHRDPETVEETIELSPERAHVRQLRFKPADDENKEGEAIEDDYDSNGSTVTFPRSDLESISSESVPPDSEHHGRPLEKSSPRGLSNLLPMVDQSIQHEIVDDDDSTNDSCSDDDDHDDDDVGETYLTPEDSCSEASSMSGHASTANLSSPTTRPIAIEIEGAGNVQTKVQVGKSPVKTRPTVVVEEVNTTLETKASSSTATTTMTKFNIPSTITDLKGMTPGDLFKKFIEYRSKTWEEDDLADEGTDGPPSLKTLVDTTVESLLSTPNAPDEGPVFVSGIYKCDFPSRKSANSDAKTKTPKTPRENVMPLLVPIDVAPPPSSSSPDDDDDDDVDDEVQECDDDEVQKCDDDDEIQKCDEPSPISPSAVTQEKLDELSIELDKTFAAAVEQASPSSVTSSTSSRRSTRSWTALTKASENVGGMQLRSRHTSTASSISPESIKQTNTPRRRSTRSSSKAKDNVQSESSSTGRKSPSRRASSKAKDEKGSETTKTTKAAKSPSRRSICKANDHDESELSATSTADKPPNRRKSLRGKVVDDPDKTIEKTLPARRRTITKFSFSEPYEDDCDKDAAELAKASPACSADDWPFSPPLTRSKSLRGRNSICTPPSFPSTRKLAVASTIKKRQSTRQRSPSSFTSSIVAADLSTILSPIAESGGDDEDSKNVEQPPQHSMTLRRTKPMIKTRPSFTKL